MCAWRGAASSSYGGAHVAASREVRAATGRMEDTDADLPSHFAARSKVPAGYLFSTPSLSTRPCVCSVEILTTQASGLPRGER